MLATKTILGLDPGLASLGYGGIRVSPGSNGQLPTLLDFGIIQTPPHTDIGQRLEIIYDDLHALLAQWQPDLVALEKLFFYRMGNTIQVAQARGIIVLVLAQLKIPLVEFTPGQVKQALTGYGKADKQEVQTAVCRELQLTKLPRPDDAADALAMALAAWFQEPWSNSTNSSSSSNLSSNLDVGVSTGDGTSSDSGISDLEISDSGVMATAK